jgi:hypothetical protein
MQKQIYNFLSDIIESKKAGEELRETLAPKFVNSGIEEKLSYYNEFAKNLTDNKVVKNTKQLDGLFFKIIYSKTHALKRKNL